jgi:hypothetical protein
MGENEQSNDIREIEDNANEHDIDLMPNENETEPGDNTQRNNKSKTSSFNKIGKPKQNMLSKVQKERKMSKELEKQYNEKKNIINNSRKANINFKSGEKVEDTYENEEVVEQNENEKLSEQFGLTLYNISQTIKKIKEEQIELKNLFKEVSQLINDSYTSLNERLTVLENESN